MRFTTLMPPFTQSRSHLQIITPVMETCNKSSDAITAAALLMFPSGSMSLVNTVPKDIGWVGAKRVNNNRS